MREFKTRQEQLKKIWVISKGVGAVMLLGFIFIPVLVMLAHAITDYIIFFWGLW